MKRKNANKRTLFIMIPLLALSLTASLVAPRYFSSTGPNIESLDVSASQSNYDMDDQKHEAPANHEPVFMAVFKFIVNCNPFKKETNL